MSCTEKRCYLSLSDAWENADDINDRRTLMFAALNVYHCNEHEGWHVGHNRKLNANAMGALVTASSQRVALRQQCAELAIAAECLSVLAA